MSLLALPRRLTRSLSKANSMRTNEHGTHASGHTIDHPTAPSLSIADFPTFALDLTNINRGPNIGTPEYYFKTATHQQLLEAGNDAHCRLFDTFNQVNAKYQQMCGLYDGLIGKIGPLFEASRHPVQEHTPPSVPGPSTADTPSTTSDSAPPKLKKEDHLQIRWWYKHEYLQFVTQKKKKNGTVDPGARKRRSGGAQLAKTGENVAMEYIEDENGNVVDGRTAADIRERMRAIYEEMSKPTNSFSLPPKWRNAGITERKFILQEMYSNYPYLRLCNDDWKVLHLASSVLSTFHSTRKRQHKKQGQSPSDDEPETFSESEDSVSRTPAAADEGSGSTSTAAAAGSKRKAPPPSTTSSKRTRTAATPTPPSNNVPIDPNLATISAPPPPTPELMPSAVGPTVGTDATVSMTPALSPTTASAPLSSSTTPSSAPSTASVMNSPPLANSSEAPAPAPAPVTCSRPKPRTKRAAANPVPVAAELPVAEEIRSQPDGEFAPQKEPAASSEPPPTLINPLLSLFGPPSGPSARADALAAARDRAVEGDNNGADAEGAPTVDFGQGMKRPTNSLAPKNLCYIEFLKTNEPITPSAFELYWKGLTKDEQKKWATYSKERKEAAGAD